MSCIDCETMAQFIEICAGLVRESIIFEADADALKIKLNGGF